VLERLDLHGMNYEDAEIAVEDFVLTAVLPAEIVTGNSAGMRNIVKRIVDKHGLGLFQSDLNNYGSVKVLEKKI